MKYFIGSTLLLIIWLVINITFFYSHSAKSQSTVIGDVYIRGEITDNTAMFVGEQIKSLNNNGVNEIVLHITSPGGSVYAGLQIYDYMRLSHAQIRTSCEGYCMSMGAYLLSWGTIRQSDEHATIMLHQVGSSFQGKLNEITNDLNETRRLQSVLNNITKEHSGISIQNLNEIEAFDNFMTPKQAKELNLIDAVK